MLLAVSGRPAFASTGPHVVAFLPDQSRCTPHCVASGFACAHIRSFRHGCSVEHPSTCPARFLLLPVGGSQSSQTQRQAAILSTHEVQLPQCESSVAWLCFWMGKREVQLPQCESSVAWLCFWRGKREVQLPQCESSVAWLCFWRGQRQATCPHCHSEQPRKYI